MSLCPTTTDYRSIPFIAADRPGVIAALKHGVHTRVPPVVEAVDYTQRDINEALSRGWLKRATQRPIDKAWSFELTPAGRVALKGVAV